MEQGDWVVPAYWIAAAVLLLATTMGAPLGRPGAVLAATVLFIGGGLPHGAYDIALLRRSMALGRRRLVLITAGYIAVAAVMVVVWMVAPLAALILFLAVAATHFGEDWPMLDEPLLRVAAGAAVIAAPTIGHPAAVASLFVAMSDERATVVAQLVAAAAPVALLVTAVGIGIAWQQGSRQWAAAMALCLALLVLVPPVAGFALFFVFLHSPRHLAQARTLLPDMTRVRWLATGALLSAAAVGGWWALHLFALGRGGENLTAQAFQLLASVAVPHLLLSRWMEQQLARTDHRQSGSSPSRKALA